MAFAATTKELRLGRMVFALAAAGAIATPAVAQKNLFTGFKGELLTGYDNEGVDYDDDVFNGGKTSQSGWMYGFGVGYDYQFSGLVIGAEGELMESTAGKQRSYSGVRPSQLPSPAPPNVPVTLNTNIDAGGDFYIGIRGGVLVAPEFLIYAKVGYTNHKIDVDGDGVDNGVAFKFNNHVKVDGFRLGIGGEYAFGNSFYGKLEYRYTNYNNGDLDIRGANVNLNPLFSGIDVVRHQALVGVGFRF
ncbi:MAG: outer membrane protein [Hyalangium sp.]|uniref:outer membrane protein n=1 Tax=Hyalangium sp. TaxID=2028555 RepID=UPI00389A9B4B